MSNEQYLIVSYFGFAAVCFGLGLLLYSILRKPFGSMADAIVGKAGSRLLKKALVVSMTMASVVGFLGVSYNGQGCVKYEDVIKDRGALEYHNIEQVQASMNWMVWTVLAWGVLVVIGLRAARKKGPSDGE